MKTAVTIHRVLLGGQDYAPQSVVEMSPENYADLKSLGAVREPTADELTLFQLSKGKKGFVPVTGRAERDVASDNARLALEKQAKELGVKFNKNLSTEKLEERINEALNSAGSGAQELSASTASDAQEDAPDMDDDIV